MSPISTFVLNTFYTQIKSASAYISLLSPENYDVKLTYRMLYGERIQTVTKYFFFSFFLNLDMVLRNSNRGEFSHPTGLYI